MGRMAWDEHSSWSSSRSPGILLTHFPFPIHPESNCAKKCLNCFLYCFVSQQKSLAYLHYQSFKEITHNPGRKGQLVVGVCLRDCFPSKRKVDHALLSRAFSRVEFASPQRHLHVAFSPSLFHDFPFTAFCCICVSTDRAAAG